MENKINIKMNKYQFQDSRGVHIRFSINFLSVLSLDPVTQRRRFAQPFPLARITELIESILAVCCDYCVISFYLVLIKQQQLHEMLTKESLKDKQGWL